MSAKEFTEYLKMLATNTPIEKEIDDLKIEKIENERWEWLDDFDE